MINVTKTYFPPIEEFNRQIERIWANEWLTNRGELVRELESTLKDFLKVRNITFMANGTLPIQIALKILAKNGEVITTPFSYVATTSSIIWENCTPKFVDIDPKYLTIDENKIEDVITENTTAILATHVFGNPCNIEAIERIALKYRLKVIYDAAHCFGVNFKGQSIFNYGDVSTCSFHATKLFHTGEGGALFCNNDDLNHQMYYSHNFGHNGPIDFYGLGINAKVSELNAAMGLSVFPHISNIIASRKNAVDFYSRNLNHLKLLTILIREDTEWNYSYYPVIFESEEILIKVQQKLNEHKIYPRRYFYPSLNTLKFLSEFKHMPISEDISKRILCLPLYAGLEENILEDICKHINTVV